MNAKTKKALLLVLLAGLPAGTIPAHAGGPLYVTGLNAVQQGRPYTWALNPIPYQTDQGGLGNQKNAEADSLVSAAFQVWEDVSTSNISFQNSGHLDYDVTSQNILTFQNALGNCNNANQPANAVVYDLDGSIIKALGYDNNSILGFAGSICSDDEAGIYTRGWAMLNGRFVDGSPDTSNHNSVTIDEFKAAFIHEFGHLIGLDHSQLNLNCLTQGTCPVADTDGVPTMFPVLLGLSQATLAKDDEAELSSLYPAPGFASTTGRIRGHVFFSDGQTPAQGYNVIARLVTDPRRIAVSCVSGFLFTAGAGNPFAPAGFDTDLFYGSRDQTLIGYYDIPGLPPGDYTMEVEALNDSGNNPFVDSSGVGPIGSDLGFQFKMPGACDLQYLNYPSSPGDSCSAKSAVAVGAGMTADTNTDVIILGTPPRYDAWEDGP
jgi:hypothetical protein